MRLVSLVLPCGGVETHGAGFREAQTRRSEGLGVTAMLTYTMATLLFTGSAHRGGQDQLEDRKVYCLYRSRSNNDIVKKKSRIFKRDVLIKPYPDLAITVLRAIQKRQPAIGASSWLSSLHVQDMEKESNRTPIRISGSIISALVILIHVFSLVNFLLIQIRNTKQPSIRYSKESFRHDTFHQEWCKTPV